MAGGEVCTVNFDGRDDVLATVAKINGKLVAGEGGDDADAVLESLRQLQAVPMTFAALEATKIGRAVNALRKSAPSEQARELAATLYRGWKALALEHLRTTLRSRTPDVSAADGPKTAPASSKKPGKSLNPNAPKAEKSVGSKKVPVMAKKPAAVTAPPASARACMKSKEKQGSNAPSETEQRPVAARQRVVLKNTAAIPKTAPVWSKPTRSSKETSPPATTISDTPTPIKAVNNKRVSPPRVPSAASKPKPLLAQPPKPSGSSSAGNKRKEAPTATSTEKQGRNAPSETEQRPVALAARQRVVLKYTAALPKTAPASSKPTRSSKETSPPKAKATTRTSPDTPIEAANNKRVSLPRVPSAASKPKPLLARPPKPSGSLNAGNKRKEAPAATGTEEASLERAKKRLHERYQDAAAVKEQRRIQVINTPVKKPTVVYRRRQVRCTVAAPAP